MDVVFGCCPKKLFGKVLELGAGDGFVSTILGEYAEQLTCTEINPERLTSTDRGNITFKICDAEKVSGVFKEKEFDMVFSSSLLEHLPDCDKALRRIRQVLVDEGIGIHFMPNRYWKLVTVLLHIPNKMAVTIDKILAGRIFKRRPGHK
jgi:ubiquinone/menaquinone biosynthesis C-methylase UbiE